MKKLYFLILSLFLFVSVTYSQLSVKNLKADVKLFSGLNTIYKVYDGSDLYAEIYDFNSIGFSYNGGLEASLRYCFQDSKTDVGLGVAYTYLPYEIAFLSFPYKGFKTYQLAPELNESHPYLYQAKIRFLNIPLNLYFNTKNSYVFNCGLSFKFLMSKENTKEIENYQINLKTKQKDVELILGFGKRFNNNLSLFFKTNVQPPGAFKAIFYDNSRLLYLNCNTNLYLVYTF